MPIPVPAHTRPDQVCILCTVQGPVQPSSSRPGRGSKRTRKTRKRGAQQHAAQQAATVTAASTAVCEPATCAAGTGDAAAASADVAAGSAAPADALTLQEGKVAASEPATAVVPPQQPGNPPPPPPQVDALPARAPQPYAPLMHTPRTDAPGAEAVVADAQCAQPAEPTVAQPDDWMVCPLTQVVHRLTCPLRNQDDALLLEVSLGRSL